MKDYQEVREQLINMLKELDERLDRISADIRRVDKPLEQDFSEQAVETENDEVLDALGDTTREEAEQIKQAISRIDAGSYGICTSCGAVIGQDRLHALPFAKLCIDCAEHLESGTD
ncbi:MAG: TraR/DksA family transcriptional regulator [Methylococcales bacterium]|nr:TraR/DksA family transcriptional regulator [Methylococcales bacterium]